MVAVGEPGRVTKPARQGQVLACSIPGQAQQQGYNRPQDQSAVSGSDHPGSFIKWQGRNTEHTRAPPLAFVRSTV